MMAGEYADGYIRANSSITTDDMTASLPGVFPDNGGWNKNPFSVRFTKTFEDYRDMLAYSIADEIFDISRQEPQVHDAMKEIVDNAGQSEESALPKDYMRKKYRDTTLGGNDAINCLYQPNEDADIIHPHMSLGSDGTEGMGRSYSEKIDDHQRIMYMSFGVPDFLGGAKFYKDAIDGELANLMSKGDNFFSIEKLGRLFGATAGFIVSIPFLPIRFMYKVITFLPNLTKNRPTKYYDFKATMPLYYKIVNTLIAHFAVNMGLVENGGSEGQDTGSKTSDKTDAELRRDINEETGDGPLLGEEGFDIYRILMRKYHYNNLSRAEYETLDDLIEHAIRNQETYKEKDDISWWDQFLQGADTGIKQTLSYIGFRVEKGDSFSETFSNQTGQSSLASTMESRSQDMANKKFTFAGGKTGMGAIDGFIGGLKGFWDGSTQMLGIDGLAKAFIGSGKIDIPDIYLSSEYNNSYSFKMVLNSVYRDPVSIMRSIQVPLSCILAGALPRAIGPNSYTSPFLVQCHCPGMFSIPMGMITDLTLTRGGDIHGWTFSNLPTKIEVSFTISDLSKAVYLTLATNSKWLNVLGQNSSFQEYMLTLSGVGLAERLIWSKNLKRRIAITKQVWKNNKLNQAAWGFRMANTGIGKFISAFQPALDLGKGRIDR